MYYDKEGQPMTLLDWGKKLEDREYKIIQQDTLPNGKWVSTIWLGLNHNHGEGKPLIFETMVFQDKVGFQDGDTERYSTLEEAQEGHKQMVKKYGTPCTWRTGVAT